MGPLEPASPPPPKRNCRCKTGGHQGYAGVGATAGPQGLLGTAEPWGGLAPAPPASFSPGATWRPAQIWKDPPNLTLRPHSPC